MVRKYKRKNAYCRNSKLTTIQTKRLIRAWFLMIPAKPTAALVGVDPETARRFFQKIRQRIMTDPAISGWIGPEFNNLPKKDAKIWRELYECILHCPAFQNVLSNIPVNEELRTELKIPKRIKHIQKYALFARLKQRHSVNCSTCTVGNIALKLPANFYHIAGSYISIYGKIPKTNFNEWFFEMNFRSNTLAGPTKKFPLAKPFLPIDLLRILLKNPL